MKTKELRSEFKKLVIMGCHPECKTYEEALEIENPVKSCVYCDLPQDRYCLMHEDRENRNGLPITIGRVMQAVCGSKYRPQIHCNFPFGDSSCNFHEGCLVLVFQVDYAPYSLNIGWKLTDQGRECSDDDQKDETIERLLNILK